MDIKNPISIKQKKFLQTQLNHTVNIQNLRGRRPDLALLLDYSEAASQVSEKECFFMGASCIFFHQTPSGTIVTWEAALAYE